MARDNSSMPSLVALLGLLAVAGYQNRDKISEWLGKQAGSGEPGQQPGEGGGLGGLLGGLTGGSSEAGQGGLGGLLGSLTGGGSGQTGQAGGLGGLLGGLGGNIEGMVNDGLGGLVDRFKENGQGETAEAWVKSGPNPEISPSGVEQALGSDIVENLVRQTGLTRDELLDRLAKILPEAIDKYTPGGALPQSRA